MAHESFGGPVEGGLTMALLAAAMSVGAVAGGVFSGWLPKISLSPSEKLGEGKAGGSLAVRLAPPPVPPPTPPPSPASAGAPAMAPPRASAPRTAPRPAPKEKLLAMERPSAPRVAPPAETEPPPTPAASQADFASAVEARRRAREAEAAPVSRARLSEPPNETQQERDNRMAAINLGLNSTPSFGDEKKRGGGIFQIERVGVDDAEFFFYGWNKFIRRNATQMIEVRRGANPTMEIAVVRKMIAIIREHENGDFVWESHRLRREVWLSARPSDNSGLEEFFMQEFFASVRRRQ